jgi:hypothetical protein
MSPSPTLWVGVSGILRHDPARGQLRRQVGRLRLPRFSVPADSSSLSLRNRFAGLLLERMRQVRSHDGSSRSNQLRPWPNALRAFIRPTRDGGVRHWKLSSGIRQDGPYVISKMCS